MLTQSPFYLINCLANYLPRCEEPEGHNLALAAFEDLRHTGCTTNGTGLMASKTKQPSFLQLKRLHILSLAPPNFLKEQLCDEITCW